MHPFLSLPSLVTVITDYCCMISYCTRGRTWCLTQSKEKDSNIMWRLRIPPRGCPPLLPALVYACKFMAKRFRAVLFALSPSTAVESSRVYFLQQTAPVVVTALSIDGYLKIAQTHSDRTGQKHSGQSHSICPIYEYQIPTTAASLYIIKKCSPS